MITRIIALVAIVLCYDVTPSYKDVVLEDICGGKKQVPVAYGAYSAYKNKKSVLMVADNNYSFEKLTRLINGGVIIYDLNALKPDFDKEIILVVFGGVTPYQDYSTEITKITVKNKLPQHTLVRVEAVFANHHPDEFNLQDFPDDSLSAWAMIKVKRNDVRMSSKESNDIVRIELIKKKVTYEVEPAVLP